MSASAHAAPVAHGDVSSQLNTPRQLTYWKRCLKTFLPQVYTSNDCNRMTLAGFIVNSLDLLRGLHDTASQQERDDYVRWIYRNQHPDGGFRAAPAMDLADRRAPDNAHWDPANLPATFFALQSLLILGDDLSRVKRRECLAWLPRLQRPEDGSFGETLGEGGRIEGGHDTRFIYCAANVRWMLRGHAEGDVDGVPDIDVDAVVQRIRSLETYDGGISEAPFHEAHAGFTYCAIGALALLGRLPSNAGSGPASGDGPLTGPSDPELTVRWLVSRQTLTLEDEDIEADGEEADIPQTVKMQGFPSDDQDQPAAPQLNLQWAGFNGRCNKIADTCYAWWAGGSLSMLGKIDLISSSAARRYLLDKTQHIVGGFGKMPGDPPDIYHSFLGLASLALLEDPGVKPINPAACLSEDACNFLESLPWRKQITG